MKIQASILFIILSLGILLSPALAGDFEAGFTAYREKDYTSAIPLLKKAVSEQPSNPNYRYYLADALLKNNRLGEAQTEYSQILAMAPGTQAARLSEAALAQMKSFAFNTDRQWNLNDVEGMNTDGVDHLVGINAGDDSYIDEISSGGSYVRWSLLKPIKIYVEKVPKNISHFEPGFVSTVPQSISTWNRVLGGQLKSMMVNSPEQADITVVWVNGLDHHGFVKDNTISFTAGLTTPDIQKKQLKGMSVRIATLDIQRKPTDQAGIYRTVVHEIGHALGLLGHSTAPSDLMYTHNSGQSEPTQRDINTIRKLYLMDNVITNLPPDPKKKNSPDDELATLKSLDRSIAKQEQQIKTLGNALSWINLGVVYAQKGEALRDMLKISKTLDKKDPKNDPSYWFNSSLVAYDKAIGIDPQNLWAYTRRATIYQYLNQNDKAYADIKQAAKIDPKEPEVYLQMAEILISMSQKSDAAIALSKFKSLAPNATSSNQYKKLEKQLL